MKHPIYLMALMTLLAMSSSSHADQPNMHAALTSLQQAKDALRNATSDKGGHRVAAIKLIEQAIAEVKAGIEYDRAHPTKED
jgi:hypothetical protein